jgi:hypothetical protein
MPRSIEENSAGLSENARAKYKEQQENEKVGSKGQDGFHSSSAGTIHKECLRHRNDIGFQEGRPKDLVQACECLRISSIAPDAGSAQSGEGTRESKGITFKASASREGA